MSSTSTSSSISSSSLSSPAATKERLDYDPSVFIPRPLLCISSTPSSCLDLLLRTDSESDASHETRLAAFKHVLEHFSGGDVDVLGLMRRSSSSSSSSTASASASGSDVDDALTGESKEGKPIKDQVVEVKDLGTLSDREKMYLSAEQILRILSRERWDAKRAIETLTSQLEWRRSEFLDDDIRAMSNELASEARSGKNLTYSFDTLGRPLIWTTPSLESPEAIPGHHQVRHSVFITERAIDLMPAGVEQMVLVIDLSGSVKRDRKTIGVMRTIVGIMQSQYRERVAAIHVRNVPWVQKALVTLLWPFVDASVRSKVTFDSAGPIDQLANMDPRILPHDRWQGQLPFKYQYPAYWQALVETCEEKRLAEENAWRTLGGKVGMAERDWRM